MLYRKVAASRSESELDQVLEELRDRYGPLPESVLNLADYGRIRVLADRVGLESIDREAQVVVFKFRPQTRLDPMRLVSLVRGRSDVVLVPPASLKLDLKTQADSPQGAIPSTGRHARAGRAASRGRETAPVSWWTARATTGEVKPGFSRDEILKPAREDPRGPNGVLTRVGQLLSDLVDRG
jgi:transcription-repair coupling factor (superfamily II helicase)